MKSIIMIKNSCTKEIICNYQCVVKDFTFYILHPWFVLQYFSFILLCFYNEKHNNFIVDF